MHVGIWVLYKIRFAVEATHIRSTVSTVVGKLYML